MRIIQGRSRKSIEVQKIIDTEKDRRILLIDSVGVLTLAGECTYFWELENNEELWKELSDKVTFKELIDNIKTHNLDLVIFETNDNYSYINKYKSIEGILGVDCVVTIQDNDLEELKIYSI